MQNDIVAYNPDQVAIFCETYMATNDPAEAAASVGIETNRSQRGTELLKQPEIRATLLEKYNAVNVVYAAERQMVMEEFLNLAKFSVGDFIEWDTAKGITFKDSCELDADQLKRICEVKREVDREGGVTVSLKFFDKLSILDKVAKILGLYVDRHQIETKASTAGIGQLSESQRKMADRFAKDVIDAGTETIDAVDVEVHDADA